MYPDELEFKKFKLTERRSAFEQQASRERNKTLSDPNFNFSKFLTKKDSIKHRLIVE